MSDDHKAALAVGRTESRIVKNYLHGLDSSRPRGGRKQTAESITRRLAAIDDSLIDADPITRLSLYQERINLHHELESMDTGVDIAALEDEFVAVARSYSTRRGISYAAWREAGVPASVLKRAGLTRSM